MILRILAILAVLAAFSGSAHAEDRALSALARLDPAASGATDRGQGVELVLGLSQPVPYRVLTLSDPPRLVVDFREVDFAGLDPAPFLTSTHLRDLRTGAIRPGWSRLVAEWDMAMRVEAAEQTRDPVAGRARLSIRLVPGAADAPAAPSAERLLWDLPAPAPVENPKRRQTGQGPLVVVLDPGHGGIDPGAERGGTSEAALMLTFARELKERLLRQDGFRVILTREDDVFVPLETRISVARAAGADVFISLHADALAEGEARGATIYTLDKEASDEAAAQLAERHDRGDLLSGVDLTGQDDEVAGVLMELARVETQPRIERLASRLTDAFGDAGIRMHKHPHQRAAFSVLKAPDIPAALIELGFLSSESDLNRLQDPQWRGQFQAAIVAALARWRVEDAAEAALLRQ